MTAILGISAYYHDSAAALVVDGRIVAAAQEERFTRKKHDASFPVHAIAYCLQQAGLEQQDIDYVGFYDKPLTKFERLLETYLAFAPLGYPSFRKAIPLWLKQKLHIPRDIRNHLPRFRRRPVFLDHHQSHAASAFFPSPFEEAAILTIDGVGEWSTTCLGIGRGNQIELLKEIRFPHSLGLLYSAFTYYAGFKVNSGEYKLMGLAPYGEPRFRDRILGKLLDLKEDGSFRMDMSYFRYCYGLTMTSPKFHELFEGPPREPETLLTQREMDIAASVQSVTEEIMLRMARHAFALTGTKHLVLAGGVALNCVGNGRISREGPFERIWVQPAAGDAGGALGTACFIWHQLLQKTRQSSPRDHLGGAFLGPEYSSDSIRVSLEAHKAVYRLMPSDEELCDHIAKIIAEGKVVGWFQGRMEFGPRALGARSILADARCERMQSTMNLKIKFRESFRPFAPIVLLDRVEDYFDWKQGEESPYMLLVAPVKQALRIDPVDKPSTAFGLDKLHKKRSVLPAITHVDYSARIQTVDQDRNPLLYQLLRSFESMTGCPVMINTSFNIRSEPIVCSPDDALRCFRMTDMDVLVLGRYILTKEEQKIVTSQGERTNYLNQFELD
jgi:carbamoyltransferase